MRRLAFLDSLRGLAAVYVALYHMTLLPTPNLIVPHWASAFVLNGGTAVTLFFVISAFSLCYATRAHGDDGENIYAFYTRRFFRIAPLFYACMVFYMFRDYYHFGVLHGIFDIAASGFFVFNFFPSQETGFVWASWAIGVEMVFYLIFPYLFTRFRSISSLCALLFASLLVSAGFREFLAYSNLDAAAQESYINFSFLNCLPVFVIGLLTYQIYDRYISGKSLPLSTGYALLLAAIFGYCAMLAGKMNFLFADNTRYWQAVIYALLLLGLAIHPAALFVNRITDYLGKISFSVYLLHPSTVLYLYPVYKYIYALQIPITAKFTASAAITLTIVIALASVSYRLIEKPGMQLGKILARRFGWTHEAQVVAS